ncbi:magnesium transporter [Pseudolabrys sp. Root1462]|uniref:magnesium transporter n=1 Tax=Pseudolabrys sp. Root1462 TaxID=1736466 RepID=UPI00070340F6|nr:magnesium transporter [Pseudolabrys sp. Root1462]KQZ02441.1 magnesium transporter [Pseudolabrys sp. Root1462]
MTEAATIDPVRPLPTLRDDDGAIRPEFVAEAARALEAGDVETLRQLVDDLHESDLGALVEALEPDQRPRLVELLGIDFDFTALTELDTAVREEILDELDAETVAEGVREIESDDAVTILADIPSDERSEILEHLPLDERLSLTRSLDYPEFSAGRRMQTEFIAVTPDWDVGRAIDYMRETADLPDQFYELYVVDGAGHFLGAVPLNRLLRAKRPVLVADLMDEKRRRVLPTETQENVAHLFQRYDMVSVPVVDEADRLVGVVTFDDVADVIQEEADEDIKALGGVPADEELSDSVWTIARYRFSWLLVNLATAFVASSVLGLFEGQLQQMVALAVLAPIVASQGGNATTQTMTVAVRALATQQLNEANARWVVLRELMVGVLNGFAFAIITGIAAYLWFDVAGLGIVIGLAMICNLVAAAAGGILIPLGLHRLRIDPAVASSPFVTTVTDVVGFFSFLAIATLWFGLR